MRIGQHHFNVESDLIGSLLNHDSSIVPSSSKIDSLLGEFAGELTLLKSIPSGIDETGYHPENEIRLSQRLLYDNSSPRPPEEFVSENSNADAESFSPSPIPIEDSNYPMEEIDLTFTPDDPMPSSIEEDNDDSRDILIRLSISITFRFSVGLQTPDDLSRSRLGFIEKIGSREIGILSFFGAYFIALREDTQHLSMGDFGNGYSRNEQKQGKNTTKPNTKWKRSEKTKSIEAESQKSKPVVNKSQLLKVKVNPDKTEAEK
nr:hypothetical protein [Tanacetum cinerariifolium]